MDAKEFKKLLREVKMPGAAKVWGSRATWTKDGGHAGKNTILKVIQAAEAVGYKPVSAESTSNADGSRMGSGSRFRRDNVTICVSSSYGVTASENHFSITLALDEE